MTVLGKFMRLTIGGALIAGCATACGSDGTEVGARDLGGGDGGSTPDCPSGQSFCGSECTPVEIDAEKCSACGVRCMDDQVCVGGVCGTECAGGTAKCGNLCVNLQSDQQHCGACNNACAAGQSCNGQGQCEISCPANTTSCSGVCVDLNTSQAHCGGCNMPCSAGQVCDGNGVCSTNCTTGKINCDDSCVDPLTDEAYCGASGDCMGDNAGSVCASAETCNDGSCEAVTCNDQFEPTAGTNDSEALAESLAADPVSDCADPEVLSGVVSGNDVDWYHFEANDDLCAVEPAASFTQSSADARLCVFVQCTSATANTQFSCPLSTTNATSPEGRYGCCETGSAVSFEIGDVNCTGTINEDIDVFIRVDDPVGDPSTCTSYVLEWGI